MKTKGRRWVFIIIIVLALPVLLYLGINLYARVSAANRVLTVNEAIVFSQEPDAILVLGAGVRPNGKPSNMLEDRLLTALALFEAGVCDRILVSGDHGTAEYDEVNVMKAYLMKKGIPSDCIFMDHAGFSTYDSVYRAKAIFGAEELLIVTQEYHGYRSLMIAKHLGVDAQIVPAPILSSNTSVYPKQGWYSFRETLARVKDFFYCIAKPEPVYLGEKISLEGGGDVTNDGKI